VTIFSKIFFAITALAYQYKGIQEKRPYCVRRTTTANIRFAREANTKLYNGEVEVDEMGVIGEDD
jgi:hypothetical protein